MSLPFPLPIFLSQNTHLVMPTRISLPNIQLEISVPCPWSYFSFINFYYMNFSPRLLHWHSRKLKFSLGMIYSYEGRITKEISISKNLTTSSQVQKNKMRKINGRNYGKLNWLKITIFIWLLLKNKTSMWDKLQKGGFQRSSTMSSMVLKYRNGGASTKSL